MNISIRYQYSCNPGKRLSRPCDVSKMILPHDSQSAGSASLGQLLAASRPKRAISTSSSSSPGRSGFFTFLELEEYLSVHLDAPVDLATLDAVKPLVRERVAATVAYA